MKQIQIKVWSRGLTIRTTNMLAIHKYLRDSAAAHQIQKNILNLISVFSKIKLHNKRLFIQFTEYALGPQAIPELRTQNTQIKRVHTHKNIYTEREMNSCGIETLLFLFYFLFFLSLPNLVEGYDTRGKILFFICMKLFHDDLLYFPFPFEIEI